MLSKIAYLFDIYSVTEGRKYERLVNQEKKNPTR